MLSGEFEQRLDDKGRATVPARLRRYFLDGAVIARGLDVCLAVYPKDAWEAFLEAHGGRLDQFTPEGRRLTRHLYGGAHEVEMDRQGRIALPARLLAYAHLERDIIVTGVRDRLEIWNRDTYEPFNDTEGGMEDVAERLANDPRG